MSDEFDDLLSNLLQKRQPGFFIADDDRAYIGQLLDAVTNGGASGIFVVLHPDKRAQFILLNSDRRGGIALLASILKRLTETEHTD